MLLHEPIRCNNLLTVFSRVQFSIGVRSAMSLFMLPLLVLVLSVGLHQLGCVNVCQYLILLSVGGWLRDQLGSCVIHHVQQLPENANKPL